MECAPDEAETKKELTNPATCERDPTNVEECLWRREDVRKEGFIDQLVS